MIRLTQHEAVAHLHLDRPEARNAISIAGWHALAEAVHGLAADTACLVLTGGAVFSAGADLAELARLADHPAERPAFRAAMRAGIDALATARVPTVAAVNGACHGAAVALVLACDLVVAGEGARFAVPPARLGIAYPREDVARIAARVGRGQAARLLFTAAAIERDEALRIGLADLAGDGIAVARAIAENDAGALAALKATLADPADPAHDAAFDARFDGARFRAATTRWR